MWERDFFIKGNVIFFVEQTEKESVTSIMGRMKYHLFEFYVDFMFGKSASKYFRNNPI